MTPVVRFTAAARADLLDSLVWYESHAPEIVPRFRQALDDVILRIQQNPRQFPPSLRNTRRALMRRFPYVVIFREADDEVFVVALFHMSRDPRVWSART